MKYIISTLALLFLFAAPCYAQDPEDEQTLTWHDGAAVLVDTTPPNGETEIGTKAEAQCYAAKREVEAALTRERATSADLRKTILVLEAQIDEDTRLIETLRHARPVSSRQKGPEYDEPERIIWAKPIATNCGGVVWSRAIREPSELRVSVNGGSYENLEDAIWYDDFRLCHVPMDKWGEAIKARFPDELKDWNPSPAWVPLGDSSPDAIIVPLPGILEQKFPELERLVAVVDRLEVEALSFPRPQGPTTTKPEKDWWFVAALALNAVGGAFDAVETYQADQRGEVIELNPLLRDPVSDRPDMKRVIAFKVGYAVAGWIVHRWRPKEANIGLASAGLAGIAAAVHNNQINRPE